MAFKFAFECDDLFSKCKYKGLDKLAKRRNMTIPKACSEIFNIVFSDIILDIIENNVTFVVPLDWGRYAEMYIHTDEGSRFKELYRKGFFSKVDFVKSGFKGNTLAYKYRNRNGIYRTRFFKLTGYYRERLLFHNNSGRNYY